MIDTSNTVTRLVAKKLELDEQLVKRVYDFYWKYGVKEAMRSGEHTAIRIAKLGTFMVSRRKLNNRIANIINFIRKLELGQGKSYKVKTTEEVIDQKKSELRILLKRRNDIAILYNENIKNRENVRLSKTDLGIQGGDFPGNEEYDVFEGED